MLDTRGRKYVDPLIEKISDYLIKLGLTPNQVTVLAFMIGISSGIAIIFRLKFLAIILLWTSGLMDAVDGAMARKTSQTTALGTLMDITFDRIVEISVIVSLGYLYPKAGFELVLLSCSIIISMTIFLTVGALSETKGKKTFYYQAGLAERTEGFIMFSFMIIFTDRLSIITLIYTAAIIFTAAQRFYEAKRVLKQKG